MNIYFKINKFKLEFNKYNFIFGKIIMVGIIILLGIMLYFGKGYFGVVGFKNNV